VICGGGLVSHDARVLSLLRFIPVDDFEFFWLMAIDENRCT
jgi:hypothetical protein